MINLHSAFFLKLVVFPSILFAHILNLRKIQKNVALVVFAFVKKQLKHTAKAHAINCFNFNRVKMAKTS